MRDVVDAGRVALSWAQHLFSLDIYDPPRGDKTSAAERSRTVISEILAACNWTWPEVYPYDHDGQVEWCCLFAGACWRQAGLDPKWLAVFFASTMRLDAWAKYQPWNEHVNHPPATTTPIRLVAELDAHSTMMPFEPQEGDILTIGDGTPAAGDHCLIVESYDRLRGVFSCISGNGVGVGPDGKRRQGIVRSQHRVGGPGYCVRRLFRPSPLDLVSP